jgi:hypothetical protein
LSHKRGVLGNTVAKYLGFGAHSAPSDEERRYRRAGSGTSRRSAALGLGRHPTRPSIGGEEAVFSAGSAIVAVPTAVQISAWLGTLAHGRPRWDAAIGMPEAG